MRDFACIAHVNEYGNRRCGRWGSIRDVADLPRDQPLCWQHERMARDNLLDRYIGAHPFETPHLPSLVLNQWPEVRRTCWAITDAAETACGDTTELMELYGQYGPPSISLCTLHADLLTGWFIEQWHRSDALRPQRLEWGEADAREWGIPYRPRVLSVS